MPGFLDKMEATGGPAEFHLLASTSPLAINHNNTHFFQWTHLDEAERLRVLRRGAKSTEAIDDALAILEGSTVTDKESIRDTNDKLPLKMQETHA